MCHHKVMCHGVRQRGLCHVSVGQASQKHISHHYPASQLAYKMGCQNLHNIKHAPQLWWIESLSLKLSQASDVKILCQVKLYFAIVKVSMSVQQRHKIQGL